MCNEPHHADNGGPGTPSCALTLSFILSMAVTVLTAGESAANMLWTCGLVGEWMLSKSLRVLGQRGGGMP